MSVDWECENAPDGFLVHVDKDGNEIPIQNKAELDNILKASATSEKPVKIIFYHEGTGPFDIVVTDDVKEIKPFDIPAARPNAAKEEGAAAAAAAEETDATGTGDRSDDDGLPWWFLSYMSGFKKDLNQELKTNMAAMLFKAFDMEKKASIMSEPECLSCRNCRSMVDNYSAANSQNKKSSKESGDYASLNWTSECKIWKKAEKLHPPKYERVEKLDNKGKKPVEEKKKLFERKLKRKSDEPSHKPTEPKSRTRNPSEKMASDFNPSMHGLLPNPFSESHKKLEKNIEEIERRLKLINLSDPPLDGNFFEELCGLSGEQEGQKETQGGQCLEDSQDTTDMPAEELVPCMTEATEKPEAKFEEKPSSNFDKMDDLISSSESEFTEEEDFIVLSKETKSGKSSKFDEKCEKLERELENSRTGVVEACCKPVVAAGADLEDDSRELINLDRSAPSRHNTPLNAASMELYERKLRMIREARDQRDAKRRLKRNIAESDEETSEIIRDVVDLLTDLRDKIFSKESSSEENRPKADAILVGRDEAELHKNAREMIVDILDLLYVLQDKILFKDVFADFDDQENPKTSDEDDAEAVIANVLGLLCSLREKLSSRKVPAASDPTRSPLTQLTVGGTEPKVNLGGVERGSHALDRHSPSVCGRTVPPPSVFYQKLRTLKVGGKGREESEHHSEVRPGVPEDKNGENYILDRFLHPKEQAMYENAEGAKAAGVAGRRSEEERPCSDVEARQRAREIVFEILDQLSILRDEVFFGDVAYDWDDEESQAEAGGADANGGAKRPLRAEWNEEANVMMANVLELAKSLEGLMPLRKIQAALDAKQKTSGAADVKTQGTGAELDDEINEMTSGVLDLVNALRNTVPYQEKAVPATDGADQQLGEAPDDKKGARFQKTPLDDCTKATIFNVLHLLHALHEKLLSKDVPPEMYDFHKDDDSEIPEPRSEEEESGGAELDDDTVELIGYALDRLHSFRHNLPLEPLPQDLKERNLQVMRETNKRQEERERHKKEHSGPFDESNCDGYWGYFVPHQHKAAFEYELGKCKKAKEYIKLIGCVSKEELRSGLCKAHFGKFIHWEGKELENPVRKTESSPACDWSAASAPTVDVSGVALKCTCPLPEGEKENLEVFCYPTACASGNTVRVARNDCPPGELEVKREPKMESNKRSKKAVVTQDDRKCSSHSSEVQSVALPNSFMDGASNVASLALNTAKNVFNNLFPPEEAETKKSSKKVKMSNEMTRLIDMGFSNVRLNQELLRARNNSLERVVEDLLASKESGPRKL